MPSTFAHAISAIAFGRVYSGFRQPAKFWILAMVCASIPDIDILGFRAGIPYAHIFGHRGFSHSIFFAALFGLIIVILFFRKEALLNAIGLWFFFFICTLSHGILDAMTTGGLGVAFFSPFENSRYFFPWRPIAVSPLHFDKFFSEWGLRVIKSELLWVGIPSLVVIFGSGFIRKILRR